MMLGVLCNGWLNISQACQAGSHPAGADGQAGQSYGAGVRGLRTHQEHVVPILTFSCCTVSYRVRVYILAYVFLDWMPWPWRPDFRAVRRLAQRPGAKTMSRIFEASGAGNAGRAAATV